MGILGFLLLISFIASVQALEYEEKPHISVSMVGSNQLSKGEERTIILTLFNDAKRVKIKYKDELEAGFFRNEEMLFTAYNLSIELVGNDKIKVETPIQKLPALPSMQPVTLQFTIKVADDASPGDYDLKLRLSYERIEKLKRLETFPIQSFPKEFRSSLTRLVSDIYMTNASITNTTVYEYEIMTKEYKLEYTDEVQEIPLKFTVKEEEVKLEVLNVSTDSLIGGGKGKIVVEFMNSGEKTARDAYVTLETPTGFEASALSISQPTFSPALTGVAGMPGGMPMPGIAGGMSVGMGMQIPSAMPSAMPSTSLSQAKAAYYVGDLEPGDKASATFYLKIDVKDGGYYPLKLKATYLDESGSLKESEAAPFGIRVEPAPELVVKAVESKVFANAKGEVKVTVTTTADLKDATLSLSANPPISVLSSEYYLGDIKAGEERTAIFKVKASSEAKAVPYPAEIKLRYQTMDEYSEANPVEIGISVSPKLEFEVEGKPVINAGAEGIVELQIKNAGSYEVRDATARLTVVDPFSSTDDTAFIGNLKPGEVATIKFKLKADREATPKLYALNLEVKYKDPEGEWVISEPIKATIEVTSKKTSYLPAIAVGVVVVAIIVGLAYRRLRK
ncbi:MAG: S-layer protein [Archaeoglobus sp.]|nr:S-layer protein [Archaeoglobus sp.]